VRLVAPDLLTVPEAAGWLRIGRTKAYELARLFEATGGTEGLPVVRIIGQLRVPRVQLEELVGCRITGLPAPAPARPSTPPDAPLPTPPRPPRLRAVGTDSLLSHPSKS
jgi:Helix-turn-helix domain